MSTEVHQAVETVTTSNELDVLFGPLFDKYFKGENQVVLKSSAVTTTDASNKRQQQPDSTSSTSTLATTVTANGNFDFFNKYWYPTYTVEGELSESEFMQYREHLSDNLSIHSEDGNPLEPTSKQAHVEKYVLNNKGRVTGQREIRPVWNNAQRVNHQNKLTHPHPKRKFVPTAVLTKSGQVPVNVVKQSSPRATTSIIRRDFNQKSASKTNNLNKKAKTAKVNNVTTAGPKVVVSAAKGNGENDIKSSACWIWNQQEMLLTIPPKTVDHTCLKDLTMLIYKADSNYQEIDGGFVAFGGSPKGGKITRKGKIRTGKLDFEDVYFVKELKFNLFSVSQMCDKKNSVLFTETECLVLSPDFKLLDESQVLLKVPRQNNMYSFDLKNVVPSGGLTCLFAKATIDESNLWHRRLGHINFKTMNKLVRGNLVRGLPSKLFENDHTCVACQKGKQHKASCKTKLVSSISQPLQMLHMDLFGPTFVRSINHKIYCLVVTDDYSRFSWVFFLATKDETSGILKTFITGIENQINHKVKIIRCDNGTEFKNNDMNQFCGMKGIKREFSVARTPQQNHSVFNSRESNVDDSLVNDRFKTGERFHAIPPPYTRNYMPSRPDLSFAGLDDSVYKTKVSETETSISKTRNFVPAAVATKSRQVQVNAAKQSSPRATTSISTARPVNTTTPKTKVNNALPITYSYFKAHSLVRRAINQKPAAKTNNFNEKVNTARVNNVTTAGPKVVVSAAKGNGEMLLSPQHAGFRDQQEMLLTITPKTVDHTCLKDLTMLIYKADSRIFDSGCSRHMIGNKSFLTDYQETDGEFVAFGGSPKGGKITGKGKDIKDKKKQKQSKTDKERKRQEKEQRNSQRSKPVQPIQQERKPSEVPRTNYDKFSKFQRLI
ncbi:putative ribonuclease H-like domain-containing protein [Tanacetum coccineum]